MISQARVASRVSILVAVTLTITKGVVGFLVGSLAILSSAVDSMLDIISSSVNYYAIKKSEEPPDETHPFGHGKFESLATFLQSLVILGSGVFILYESYQKFITKGEVLDIDTGLYVMVFSIVVTLLLTRFLKSTAKKIDSMILKADAMHYEIDVLTNGGILISLLLIKATGFYIIDPIISAIISIYIIYSAISLNINVSKDLLDVELPKIIKDDIIKILDSFENLHVDYHKLRTRRSGSQKFLDLHLTLCRHLSLSEAHKISDVIEEKLMKNIKDLDVTIHIDPCDVVNCPGIEACNDSKLRLELDKLIKMEEEMSDFTQNLIAERLGGKMFGKDTKIYKFEKIKRAKRAALEANPGKELIDMGVGEPDDMANIAIVNVLKEEVMKKENRFYSDNGIQEFKDAASLYMKNRFNVDIDPKTEVNHAIGSKPALAMFPFCVINPGDYTLMTIPGYPVTGTITKYIGGNVYNLPLLKENNFLPDLDAIPQEIKEKAKLLYLNYPNNPTGALASREFFEKVVDFAKKNNVVVLHDAAYIELTYGEKQPSFLSVDGAKDVGVEVHSLSKSYNMTGWRMAFVCGNETLVKAFATVKDNNDSGQFIPIQKAAAYALAHPELIDETRKKYQRRLTKLSKVLREQGFYVNEPKGTFYLYFEIPKGTKSGRKFESAEEFCDYLIREKLISSVPWDDAGHFLRFTVTFEAKDLKDEDRIIGEISKRLSEEEFIF